MIRFFLRTNGLTEVFHEALADLKSKMLGKGSPEKIMKYQFDLPIVHWLGGVCDLHQGAVPHKKRLVGVLSKEDSILVRLVPVEQDGQHH